MVYLLLGVQLFVRFKDHSVVLRVAISLVAGL